VQLGHLSVDADEASLFQRLAGHVLYADPSTRPSSDAIRRGGGTPAALWAQGISGDIPIVLVRIDDIEDIAIVGQLLRAHEYWQMKQLELGQPCSALVMNGGRQRRVSCPALSLALISSAGLLSTAASAGRASEVPHQGPRPAPLPPALTTVVHALLA